MALGKVLQLRIGELKDSSENKFSPNAFWIKLRDIAKEEIQSVYPDKVDSDIIVPIYYDILSKNLDSIPPYFRMTLPSNGQERFRVINRNMFTSNAFNPEGLAHQKGIKADKYINESKKGLRVIYQGDGSYVSKK